jgi:hypothetical protein
MRPPYRLWILGLVLCAVAAVVGAVTLLRRSRTADLDAEMGRWLLTVALALLLTGALGMIVRQIDQRRAERGAWHGVLNDLVAASQTVAMVRLRLAAHRSALTYQQQLAELVGARLELRRISAIDIVIEDRVLREQVNAMRSYLEALGQEYETGYLRVARQQRLDELWLTDQMKAANDGTGAPDLPEPLAEPTTAWLLLTDKARFPGLAALLDHRAFAIDTFRTSYKLAKGRLEMHAGYGDRSTDAWTYLARRLAERATQFIALHKDDMPPKVRDSVEEAARKVEDACQGRDAGAIEEATVGLCKATPDAVRAIYPSRERNSTAVEHRAGAAMEPKGDPARPPTSPPAVGTDV